ncbi:MAG TPA: ATP-binding protein [Polyangiaceae bacterium]|nr:ATP-binding protein [Polyangiaceae bacterium]
MDPKRVEEFAAEEAERLFVVRKWLNALEGSAEPNIAATIEALYRVFSELELAAIAGNLVEQAELARDAQTVVDRIRAHRLPVSTFVLNLLRDVVACLSLPEVAAGTAAVRRAIADVTVTNDAAESDRTDLEIFTEESGEQLESCRRALARWQDGFELEKEAIDAAFRTLHTFKGNCGLMGLATLEGLSRTAEDALGGLRSGELSPTNQLRAGLVGLLTTLQRGLTEPTETGDHARQALLLAVAEARVRARETRLGDLLIARNLVDPVQIQAALAWQQRPLGEVLVELQALSPQELEEVLNEQRRLRDGAPSSAKSRITRQSSEKRIAQVQADRLTALVELVAELGRKVDDFTFAEPDHASAPDLKDLAFRTREAAARVHLLPIAKAFKRVQLLVDDMARKQGKLIDLHSSGLDLEVEGATLESLATVLLHTSKNAIDHGLESPEARVKAGKPARGQLRIAFAQAAGTLNISISDDGRGLDRERIVQRAGELGIPLLNASDAHVFELIFRPGFSTSERITDASGRGVGMDAVRGTVEALGGSIRVMSRAGNGTTVAVALPQQVGYEAPLTQKSDALASTGEPLAAGTWPRGGQEHGR